MVEEEMVVMAVSGAQPVAAPVAQPHCRITDPLPVSPPAKKMVDADDTSVGNLRCAPKKAHALLSARSCLCDANHGRAACLDSVQTPFDDFLFRIADQRVPCPVRSRHSRQCLRAGGCRQLIYAV